jgi:lipopolysaccharide transport system ATP-binding protein
MKSAISVQRLSKVYWLGSRQQGYRTLRESLTDGAKALWAIVRRKCFPRSREEAGATKAKSASLWALNDVSFEVKPGEMVGIIGRNGAGKSTLLKVLSRITEPTSGRVAIRGRVGSLLEVGTGFHPELTGRENIFLNGAILNMSKREILRRFDDIVAFAEIEKFLDTPVKRYSSGMYVRLAFSVAAHTMPDLLLIDEVLAVGDLKFQRKCMEHAKRLQERNSTVLIVSHNMFAVKALSSRAIYLSEGRVLYDGSPEEAIRLYETDSRLDTVAWAQGREELKPSCRPITITQIETVDESGRPATVFQHGERMGVRLHFEAGESITDPCIAVAFIRSDEVGCCNYNTVMDGFTLPSLYGQGILEMRTLALKLTSELYTIHILVWDRDFQKLYCAQVGPTFHVSHDSLSSHFGVFHEPAEWVYRGDDKAAG